MDSMEAEKNMLISHTERITSKLCSIFDLYLQEETFGVVLGFGAIEEIKTQFKYKEFCVKLLKDEISQIDDNYIDQVIENVLDDLFHKNKKFEIKEFFDISHWLLESCNVSLKSLIVTFFNLSEVSLEESKAWLTCLDLLIYKLKYFNYRDLRKLLSLLLSKIICISKLEKIDLIIDKFSQFIRLISSKQKYYMPRLTIYNELLKNYANFNDEIHPKLKETLDNVFLSFKSFSPIITLYKRSLFFPIVGITNIIESNWHIDHNTFLFKTPLLFIHQHNSFNLPEVSIIKYLILNYYIPDIFNIIFETKKTRLNQQHFTNCVFEGLKNLINALFTYKPNIWMNNDLKLFIFRPLFDFLCVITFRDWISLEDLFSMIKVYFKTLEPDKLLTYIICELMSNLLPMHPASFTSTFMHSLASHIAELCIYEHERNDLYNNENKIIVQSLFQAWSQVAARCHRESIILDIPPPEPIEKLLLLYSSQEFENMNDFFGVKTIFYLNIFQPKIEGNKNIYMKIIEPYFQPSNEFIKLPNDIKVYFTLSLLNLPISFLENIKFYPLTIFSNCLLGLILDKSKENPNFIIPLPVLEIIHLLTLGKYGNQYRINHCILNTISKLFLYRANNSLVNILELLTYKASSFNDGATKFTIYQSLPQIEHAFKNNRQFLVYLYTCAISIITRMPKFNQIMIPQFVKSLNMNRCYFENIEMNMITILNFVHASHFYGWDATNCSKLSTFVNECVKLMPHRWNSDILAKFPPELQQYYNENEEFNETKFVETIKSLKRLSLEYSNFKDFVQHLKTESTFPYLICLIYDQMTGEALNERYLLCSYQYISGYMISSGVRYLIYYILKIKSYTTENGKINEFIRIASLMIWANSLFSLDQLILSLLMFQINDKLFVQCFYIIKQLISDQSLKNRLEYYNSLNKENPTIKDNYNQHIQYHNHYPEHFDSTLYNATFTASELYPHSASASASGSSSSSSSSVLPIYYNNIILRMSFYIDYIIWFIIQIPDLKTYFYTSIIKEIKYYSKFHPSPITFILTLYHYNYEIFEESMTKNEKYDILKIYLTQKYTSEILEKVFTEEFNQILFNRSFIIHPSSSSSAHFYQRFVENVLAKIYFTMLWPRIKLLSNYGKPLDEFNNDYSYQTICCSILEIIILLDRKLFAETLINLFLNKKSIIYLSYKSDNNSNSGSNNKEMEEENINNYQYYIEIFAILLSSLPMKITNECLIIISKHINNLQSNNIYPLFLQQQIHDNHNNSAELFDTSSILFMLLRSYFHYIPLGHLSNLPQLIKTYFSSCINNEYKFLLIMSSTIPSLQRLHLDNNKHVLTNITLLFYEYLYQINQVTNVYLFPELISDIFYLFKYKFTEENVTNEISQVVESLKPDLKKYFSFIL